MSTLPTVWILMKGEDHEGGDVLGVFASKETGKAAFLEAARNIPFQLDRAWQDDDGAVNVHGGCDWVSFAPYPVEGDAPHELEAGR
ncbi:hypothetical protein ACFCWT_13405 [Streptomyces olivaceus]|uniref:hypothetical protein n=1 Tax=Streptomyces olivaceus TaxID=47716 RepID=UPI0035DDA112